MSWEFKFANSAKNVPNTPGFTDCDLVILGKRKSLRMADFGRALGPDLLGLRGRLGRGRGRRSPDREARVYRSRGNRAIGQASSAKLDLSRPRTRIRGKEGSQALFLADRRRQRFYPVGGKDLRGHGGLHPLLEIISKSYHVECQNPGEFLTNSIF